jgi:hypothetical protein
MSIITTERLTKILSKTQTVISECNSRGVHGSVEVNARLFENVLIELLRHRAAMLQGADGNSPDGWVACSERMPHIGVPVITCCGDVVQYAAYAWDGKEWQDWYEEYDKLPASTFTHWHPRPAAPQQELKNG